MSRDDLRRLVHIAARYAAAWEADDDLYRKVRAGIGRGRSSRLISAVTVFHVWLLKGRPDKEDWMYFYRLQYTMDALDQFRDEQGIGRKIEPRPTQLQPSLPC